MTEEDIKEYNLNYHLANEYAKGIMIVDNKVAKMTEENIVKARKAILHYKICLEISDQWVVRLFLGKIYQWLGENGNALHQFLPAMDMEQENAALPREAALCAMDYGDIEFALELSFEAIRRSPNKPDLIGNYALNLLLNKEDEKALEWSKKAIELDAVDPINQKVHHLIKAVISGEKKRPTFKELFKR